MPTTTFGVFTRLKHDRPMEPADAAHVLAVLGEQGGYMPGAFTERLIQAAAVADLLNAELIRKLWPGIANAVWVYKFEEEGVTFLKEVAAGN